MKKSGKVVVGEGPIRGKSQFFAVIFFQYYLNLLFQIPIFILLIHFLTHPLTSFQSTENKIGFLQNLSTEFTT
jgi:hypothetical protein